MACPDEFRCPITQEMMTDPVVATDGYTYERSAITEWLKKNPTSPMTRQPIRLEDLKTNRALKQSIDRFKTAPPTVVIEVKQKQEKQSRQPKKQKKQTPTIEPTPNLYYELLEQAEYQELQRQPQQQQSQQQQQQQQQQQSQQSQAIVVRPNIQKVIMCICPLTVGIIVIVMIVRLVSG